MAQTSSQPAQPQETLAVFNCSKSPGVKPDVDKIILGVLEGRREVVLESGIDSSLRVDSMLVIKQQGSPYLTGEVVRPGVGVLGRAPRLAKEPPI